MSDEVIISVRSQLLNIAADLDKVTKASEGVSKNLKTAGNEVGKNIQRSTRETESFFNNMRGVSGRVAEEIKNDFKALFGLQALAGSLKMSSHFNKTISDTVALGDKLRKMSGIFDIAKNSFVDFESRLVKGMGAIGLGAEEAINSLEGLSQTQVRGEQNLIDYSTQSSALAQLSGQKGSEGDIAKGLANAVRDIGGDQNDPAQMRAMSEVVRSVYNSTGAKPTQILSDLSSILEKMPEDFRKSLNAKSVGSLATISSIAGPNAVAFLKDYLGASPIQRSKSDAMGFGGVMGPKGFDVDKFNKAITNLTSNFPGDKRLMAQQVAGSPEAAEGLIRISENLDKIREAEDKRSISIGDVTQQMHESMSMSEAFAASLNKVKSAMAGPMSKAQEGITEALTKASESDAGSAAVAIGAATFSALLAGGALKAIAGFIPGGSKAAGIAEAAAAEKITGKSVQNVYVVNATEIGMNTGSSIPGVAGGASVAAGTSSIIPQVALAAGIAAGAYLLSQQKVTDINGQEQSAADMAEKMFDTLVNGKIPDEINPDRPDKITGGMRDYGKTQITELTRNKQEQDLRNLMQNTPWSQRAGSTMIPPSGNTSQQYVKVTVDLRHKDLKATAEPARGSNH